MENVSIILFVEAAEQGHINLQVTGLLQILCVIIRNVALTVVNNTGKSLFERGLLNTLLMTAQRNSCLGKNPLKLNMHNYAIRFIKGLYVCDSVTTSKQAQDD